MIDTQGRFTQKEEYEKFMRGQMNISDNLLETIEYNEPTTPIKAVVSYLSDYPGLTMPCHWHRELECIVVLEGSMNYYVNDRTFPLAAGQGLIVNTNRLHLCGPLETNPACSPQKNEPQKEFHPQTKDCRYAVLLLSPDSLRFNRYMEEKYIDPLLFDVGSDVFYFDGTQSWHKDAIGHILSIFQDITEKNTCFELTCQSHFFSLWSILYENTIARNGYEYSETDPMSPLKKMLSYIQDNYQNKITLQDIAQAGMMCQSKCCRLFRDNLRQSPMVYLQKLRIQKGISLLEHTDWSITEIALECGFHGASYFTETFRKVTGTTPKEYRKTLQPKHQP